MDAPLKARLLVCGLEWVGVQGGLDFLRQLPPASLREIFGARNNPGSLAGVIQLFKQTLARRAKAA